MEVDSESHECGLIISDVPSSNLEVSDLECSLNLEKPTNGEMLITSECPDIGDTEGIIPAGIATDQNTVILEGCLSFSNSAEVDSQQTVIESGYSEIDAEWHMQMVANGNMDATGLVTDVKTGHIQTIGEMGDEWHMQIQLISLVADSEVKVENEETVTACGGESADKISLVQTMEDSQKAVEKFDPTEANIILIHKEIETEENCIPLEVVTTDDYGNAFLDVGVQTIGQEYTVTDEVCSSDEKEVEKVVSSVPKKFAVTSNTCTICGLKFPDRSACQRHMIGVHEEAKHQCTKCKKTFFRLYSLKLHIKKKHNGEGLFFCDKCKYCFICKFYFDQHRKRNCTPVHCRECGRGLGNLIQLHNHRRWVHKLKV